MFFFFFCARDLTLRTVFSRSIYCRGRCYKIRPIHWSMYWGSIYRPSMYLRVDISSVDVLEVDILGVDVLGVDVSSVDILR
jgi:hypothetical protein